MTYLQASIISAAMAVPTPDWKMELRARLAEHHGLHVGQRVLQLADGGDLLADVGIDTGQAVSGRGHGQGSVAADFSSDLVNFFFGLGEHLVRAVEDAFKQCLHCCYSFLSDSFFGVDSCLDGADLIQRVRGCNRREKGLCGRRR